MCIYIYISVCVSVLLGFLFFCKELMPTSLHFLMISLQDLKLQVIFFQW